MNLATFDLNLLLVFDAVLRERHVTKAGAKLGLSQSAMSHALNRLRWLLKDQLFVRTPEGMMPTPRAEELANPVRQVLSDLQSALQPELFDPAASSRRFGLAVNNYAAVVLAGPIVADCAALAPNLHLSLRPSGTLNVADMLDRGELDLAITAVPPPGDRFASQLLLEDRYVAVMRRGHPHGRKPLDMPSFTALPHLTISSSGEDLSFVDQAIAAHGQRRRVALEAPYLSAGSILVQSAMIAVLGRRLAEEFRRAYPIELMELPFQSPPLRCMMSWHKRLQDQPAHRWLRERTRRLAASR